MFPVPLHTHSVQLSKLWSLNMLKAVSVSRMFSKRALASGDL